MNDRDENEQLPEAEHTGRWQRLWRRPGKWYWFGIPMGGFLMFAVGIVFWGGFNTAMEFSNSEAFCTSCHGMTVAYEEYQQSVHFNNASGVSATCSNCHVPKPWGAKVMRKVQASLVEIPAWILGTIDTPEKYEAHRAEMAERVWAAMRTNDSRECRSCHSLETMNLELQERSAQRRHTVEWRDEKGETCIDCHQGVAHKLPEGY